MTLYEDLKAKRFSLESRRNKLIKDRDIINAMLNEVEQEIIDIEAILTKHGTLIYRDYVENSEVENDGV